MAILPSEHIPAGYLKSENINVTAFHNILLWPLILRGDAAEKKCAAESDIYASRSGNTRGFDIDKPFDGFVDRFRRAGWQEIEPEKTAVDSDITYEEIVYFHPQVRDFLFGDGKLHKKGRLLRRFQRVKPIRSVRIMIEAGQNPVVLKVERVELLLIKPRVALLKIEISNRNTVFEVSGNEAEKVPAGHEPTPVKPISLLKINEPRTPLSLNQVLYIQERFRKVYPGYFLNNDAGTDFKHGDSLFQLEWDNLVQPTSLTLQGNSGLPATREPFDEFSKSGAEPPIYAHWRAFFQECDESGNPIQQSGLAELITPLRSAADLDDTDRVILQQLIDNRMPAMSFIATDDPALISHEDMDRFAAFDPPDLSYSPEFNARVRDSFRYDRFSHFKTNYFCNGTSFVMLCGSNSPDYILSHFRSIYTHLAVIAQYQHAALIFFASEMAKSAKLLARSLSSDDRSVVSWRKRSRSLQLKFLKFRTRSYFTEVSNQVQGKDLFRLWLLHLGTESKFRDVSETSSQISETIENYEVRQLTEDQQTLSSFAHSGLKFSIGLNVMALCISFISFVPTDKITRDILFVIMILVAMITTVFWSNMTSEATKKANQED